MTQFSVAKCAELVGVKERTIHRKIKDGKLSATKNHQGYFVVDAAELYRVYPQQSDQDITPKIETDKTENAIISNSSNNATNNGNDATLRSQLKVATHHIKLLEDQLVYYKTRLDKLEAREDKLLESALENQKLLTASRTKTKKRWFGR